MKTYFPRKDQIRELVTGKGDCVASDAITLTGRKVGYMLRETPDSFRPAGARGDSGWRFFAGDESDAYVANTANFNIFPVNSIANLDADVIALLDQPVGSAFARENGTDAFKAVAFPKQGRWKA